MDELVWIYLLKGLGLDLDIWSISIHLIIELDFIELV